MLGLLKNRQLGQRYTAADFPKVSMDEVRQYEATETKVDWQKNLAQLQPEDMFIVSYPRSGNTWMRLMLVDIFWQLSGNDTRDKKLVMLHFSPTLEKLDFSKLVRPQFGKFLVKSHSSTVVGRQRFIYLFRDPVDAIVSHYRFIAKRTIEPMEQGLQDFFKTEIEGWKKSINVAVGMRSRGLIISYEDMLAHPHKACRKACDFIGLPATDEQIAIAVENQSMDKVISQLQKRGLENEKSFRFAHGKSGAGSQYLSPDFELNVETLCEADLALANKHRCKLDH